MNVANSVSELELGHGGLDSSEEEISISSVRPSPIKRARSVSRSRKRSRDEVMSSSSSGSDESSSDAESEQESDATELQEKQLKALMESSKLPKNWRAHESPGEYEIESLESIERKDSVRHWVSEVNAVVAINGFERPWQLLTDTDPKKDVKAKRLLKLELTKNERLAQKLTILGQALLKSLEKSKVKQAILARVETGDQTRSANEIFSYVIEKSRGLDICSSERAKRTFTRNSWKSAKMSLMRWFEHVKIDFSKLPKYFMPAKVSILRQKILNNINAKESSNISMILNRYKNHTTEEDVTQDHGRFSNQRLVNDLQRAIELESGTDSGEAQCKVFCALTEPSADTSDTTNVFFGQSMSAPEVRHRRTVEEEKIRKRDQRKRKRAKIKLEKDTMRNQVFHLQQQCAFQANTMPVAPPMMNPMMNPMEQNALYAGGGWNNNNNFNNNNYNGGGYNNNNRNNNGGGNNGGGNNGGGNKYCNICAAHWRAKNLLNERLAIVTSHYTNQCYHHSKNVVGKNNTNSNNNNNNNINNTNNIQNNNTNNTNNTKNSQNSKNNNSKKGKGKNKNSKGKKGKNNKRGWNNKGKH